MSTLLREEFTSCVGAEIRATFENRHSTTDRYTVVLCLFGVPVPPGHAWDVVLERLYTYRIMMESKV